MSSYDGPVADPTPARPAVIRVPRKAAPRSAKERLTRDRIVDVALEQMREHGYEAVSMRSIARALDTGPASLYAHFANREELDQVIVERVTCLVPLPDPDPERWDEQLADMLMALLRIYREHPGVARATMGMVPTAPDSLRVAEAMMALCRAGGIDDLSAAFAIDMFSLYVGAVAVEEDIWAERAKANDQPVTEGEIAAELREFFSALPADKYPLLRTMASVLTSGDGDERPRWAIELLVAGLKVMSDRRSR